MENDSSSYVAGAWPYSTSDGAPAELAVVCSNCSHPVVKEFDEQGRMTGFREERGPLDEEQALAEGWLDLGLGLFCPKCSLIELERAAKEKAEGAESSVSADFGEIIDASIIKGIVPSVSDDTVAQFVRMFRSERLNRFRVLAGLSSINIYTPVPKNEAQAQEFLDVANALYDAKAAGMPVALGDEMAKGQLMPLLMKEKKP